MAIWPVCRAHRHGVEVLVLLADLCGPKAVPVAVGVHPDPGVLQNDSRGPHNDLVIVLHRREMDAKRAWRKTVKSGQDIGLGLISR